MKRYVLYGLTGILLGSTPLYAQSPSVVISEIAWMGTETSTNDEWLELWNSGSEPVDLTGWTLKSDDEKINIPLSGSLEADAYLLLERTDDTTLPDIEADAIYTGALKNDGVGLRLFDASGSEIDYVDKWHAGDNTSKATMQRRGALLAGTEETAWCTVLATPKGPANCPTEPGVPTEPEPETMPEAAQDSIPAEPPRGEITQIAEIEEDEAEKEPDIPRRHFENGSVIFKSVLPNPDGTDKGNEKIELRNRSYETINLKYWSITNQAGKRFEFAFWEVKPNEVITLFDGQFGFTLKNTEDTLTLRDPVDNSIDVTEWKNAKSGQKIPSSRLLSNGVEGTATRVIDGDTFDVEIGGQKLVVRLIGVDTPETVHPSLGMQWYGKEATDFLKNTVEGKTVRLIFENQKIDRYGRALAYVYQDDLMINEEILKKGYGYAYLRFPFSKKDHFRQLEEEAKRRKIGLWESKTNEAHVNQARDIAAWSGETLSDMASPPAEMTDEAEEMPTTTETAPDTTAHMECMADKLVIEAIVPNPTKGEEEWIRIKNMGDKRICLAGWQLDDALTGGSKPFRLQDAGIGGGGVRTYRKNETKISLNNSNDCAFLIAPNGDVADQICYQKTRSGELVTHEGVIGVAPTTIAGKAKKSATILPPVQDPLYSQWELSDGSQEFMVESVDEATGLMRAKLIQPEAIPIYFAHSGIDWPMVKSLVDFSEPIMLNIRLTDSNPVLVGIQKKSANAKAPVKQQPTNYLMAIGFLLGLGAPTKQIKRLLSKAKESFGD